MNYMTKRDQFKFPIVNFPCLSGNIPTRQSYSVFTAQLIRYARSCQHVKDFHFRTKILTNKLLKQYFTLPQLQKTYNKFLEKYSPLLEKYSPLLKKKLTNIITDDL